MKIKKVRVYWSPVQAQDLAGYNVYIGKGVAPDYTSEKIVMSSLATEAVLPDIRPTAFTGNELFYVGISSFDATGNESVITVATLPFDFTPPPPPTDVGWSVL